VNWKFIEEIKMATIVGIFMKSISNARHKSLSPFTKPVAVGNQHGLGAFYPFIHFQA